MSSKRQELVNVIGTYLGTVVSKLICFVVFSEKVSDKKNQ